MGKVVIFLVLAWLAWRLFKFSWRLLSPARKVAEFAIDHTANKAGVGWLSRYNRNVNASIDRAVDTPDKVLFVRMAKRTLMFALLGMLILFAISRVPGLFDT